ncbi:MAG: hypothetical protein GY842_11995 [bacterium]|nr:hypothetical protein [bacterium]
MRASGRLRDSVGSATRSPSITFGVSSRWRRRSVGRMDPGAGRAVTLVELLVVGVVACMVLMILPASLRAAREQCRKPTCAARLGYLAKACAVYMEESGGWFPGSPATTGQQLWPEGGSSLPPDAVDTPGDVVQIWDWAAPIAAKMMPLDPNREVRWRTQLIEGVFACPSNHFEAGPYPQSIPGSFGPQRMVSYNSMRSIMLRGGGAPYGDPERISLQYFHPQVGGGVDIPSGYAPRIELVGNPSRKVFLADGSRFTDAYQGTITYNYGWKPTSGGAFSSGAPTDPDMFMRSFLRSARSPELAAYSYRHGCGEFLGLNAGFFDGHVEWMSEALSRWPDPWWPPGTIIPRAEMNRDALMLVRFHLDSKQRYLVGD